MSATVTSLATATGTLSSYHGQHSSFAYDSVSGLLFGVFVQADGDIAAAAWNADGTLAQGPTVLHSALDPGDSHAAPILIIRSSDRKVICWYAAHNGAALYQRVSSAAANITAWAAETDLDASLGGTGSQYTYPMAVELSDGIYLFYRRDPGGALHAGAEWAYSVSTNNGATWAAETLLVSGASQGIYWMLDKTSSSRIDFMCVNKSPFDEAGGSAFHFYMEAGNYYETDGTEITASLPIDTGDMTQVWVSDGAQRAAPYGSLALGSDNRPRLAFTEFETASPENAKYIWCRWTGSAWMSSIVASAGSGSLDASCCLEPGKPNAIWYSKDVAGVAQIFRAITGDHGTTFGHSQASSGSEEHAALVPIANAGSSQKVAWQYLTGGWTRNDTVNANFAGGVWAGAPGVFVDWASDGAFDDAATTDDRLARMMPMARGLADDITADVHSIDWAYGGSSDHVSGASPGTMTLTVKNSDGKYNPDNTASTLYGYLKPGKRVWFGLNADGTISGTGQAVYGMFAGFIREIVPLVEGGATALAEIICDDPMGSYVRRPVKVTAATDYSYFTLREAILADIGETRFTLASEIDTMPLASAESLNALSLLEEINGATGSRHWSNPADSKEDWQSYTVVDRHYKLEAAADAAINADDVQGLSGYRVTADNIVNYQQVDVAPARFPAGVDTVWTHADATFPLTTKRTIWAQFDDFVKDAVIDYTNTGGAVTTALTNFGTTAKIELWSASSSVVQNLTIEGRMVQRDANEAVTAEDVSSQAAHEKRAGSTISSTYSSTTALAQGIADFAVWKFKQPLKRPAITFINEFSSVLPRDMYDVPTLTVDRLHVVARRFEIVGISGHYEAGPLLSVTWELQETPNQSALSLFTIGESLLGGSDVLAI